MRGLGLAARIAERFGLFVAPSTRAGLDPWSDLSRIRPMTAFRTVLDIGAHHGETVLQLRRRAPGATIHAFEPYPASFQRLKAAVGGMSNVCCWNTCVGDRDGSAMLYLQGTDYEFSLIPSKPAAQSIPVSIMTLDRFAFDNGIGHMDLLKTDTEGNDLQVLQGASMLLTRGAVDVVYSEFGIDAGDKQHTLLSDLSEYLGGFGFRLLGLYEIQHFSDPWRLGFGNALFARMGDAG